MALPEYEDRMAVLLAENARLREALEEAQQTIENMDAIRVEDHVWFDHKCHKDGCQSLVLQAKLAALTPDKP